MMGAIQPFISGAISKTVNLPETATIDEVAQLYVEAWKLGVKAVAIYRDNCKVAQPLSGKSDKGAQQPLAPASLVAAPRRRRLPDDRTEIGRKFRVGEYEGYIHVGVFDDGQPGDIFVDIAKDGTTLQGLMNSLCIAVSMGLQYGVPPEVYVSKLSHLRFEPSGPTNDADIRAAKSIPDYIFRWLGKKFLDVDQQEEAGHPLRRGAGQARRPVRERWRVDPGSRRAGARPDGALQLLRGRDRVQPLRRPDGAGWHVLHVPRLWHVDRLRLNQAHSAQEGCPWRLS